MHEFQYQKYNPDDADKYAAWQHKISLQLYVENTADAREKKGEKKRQQYRRTCMRGGYDTSQ